MHYVLLRESAARKKDRESTSMLEKDISTEELEWVVHLSHQDKAPSPDGLNMREIKLMWPHIKGKLLACFKEICSSGNWPRGLNSSFMALIPKVLNPREFKDFRPISLINSSIKIFTKVVTNRLSPMMVNIIDDYQNGFIKGVRQQIAF